MSKDAFKTFVRSNPSLASFVNNDTMTWQKFYEMFELYGTTSSVWDKYLTATSKTTVESAENAFKEIINMAKGIDLKKVQKGITNVQKTISLIQDLGSSSSAESLYERIPSYRRFDD